MTDATELNGGGVDSKSGIAALIAVKCVSATSLPLLPLIIGALVTDASALAAEGLAQATNLPLLNLVVGLLQSVWQTLLKHWL